MKIIKINLILLIPSLIFAQEFRSPDTMARFIHDEYSTVYEMIANNMEYPLESRINCIQGKIFVEFIVRKDGSVDEVKCINHLDDPIDDEAVRVINLTNNKWKPATMDQKEIDSRMVLPIILNHQNKRCSKAQLKHFRTGIAHYDNDRLYEAISNFEYVVSHEPSNVKTLHLLAKSYYKLNNLDSACANWDRLRQVLDQQGVREYVDNCGTESNSHP